jgi:hypothetical protein
MRSCAHGGGSIDEFASIDVFPYVFYSGGPLAAKKLDRDAAE